jgi:hypothetical protein
VARKEIFNKRRKEKMQWLRHTLASSTLPNGRNASSSPLSVVLHDNPPTKHLNSSGSTSAMDPHCDANPKSPLLSTFNKGLKTKTWNPPKQKEKQDLDAIQSSILETLLEGHEERKEKKGKQQDFPHQKKVQTLMQASLVRYLKSHILRFSRNTQHQKD